MFINLLEIIKSSLLTWQTLIGSMIGAVAPLFVLLCAEKYKQQKQKKEYLYYLQRIVVDQINMVIEVRKTTQSFLNEKLVKLLKDIVENPDSAYSVNRAFFPLFSIRSIPDDINAKTSSSGYIDNKVGDIYRLSKDFPHIFNDIRLQLQSTLEQNEKICFAKLNSPQVQKKQYIENITQYKNVVESDILEKNIPIYLRKLTETLIAVQEKTRRHSITWKLKFDPRWKFYLNSYNYEKAKKEIIENMDEYFKSATDKKLEEIINF